MARLEDLTLGARVTGVVAGQTAAVVAVQRHSTAALTLTYRDDAGRPSEQLLYGLDEPGLGVDIAAGPAWSLTADGALFRLVSEACRIQLAYLYDPLLAVSTSNVMPLPHQISAVYEEMLTRQPLHFLLADDPGAGKTIMAGLRRCVWRLSDASRRSSRRRSSSVPKTCFAKGMRSRCLSHPT